MTPLVLEVIADLFIAHLQDSHALCLIINHAMTQHDAPAVWAVTGLNRYGIGKVSAAHPATPLMPDRYVERHPTSIIQPSPQPIESDEGFASYLARRGFACRDKIPIGEDRTKIDVGPAKREPVDERGLSIARLTCLIGEVAHGLFRPDAEPCIPR